MENLKETEYRLRDAGVDEGIILRWILKKL
jgi:hypothetical protein